MDLPFLLRDAELIRIVKRATANRALGHRPGLKNAPVRVKGAARYANRVHINTEQPTIFSREYFQRSGLHL